MKESEMSNVSVLKLVGYVSFGVAGKFYHKDKLITPVDETEHDALMAMTTDHDGGPVFDYATEEDIAKAAGHAPKPEALESGETDSAFQKPARKSSVVGGKGAKTLVLGKRASAAPSTPQDEGGGEQPPGETVVL